MSNVEYIQSKILEMSGGAFERLFDAYLYKKYGFNNIQTLGVQTGTNKTTSGTPDSYVVTDDGKYILITCGSVKRNAFQKIKSDILACLDNSKVAIKKEKIKKIICGHVSTNIHIDQFETIRNLLGDIEVELVGIDTISHDLAYYYPIIAKEHLNISIDTNQILDIDSFVSLYDKSKINAPIKCDFWFRESEVKKIIDSVNDYKITAVVGAPGVGKTRLTLEVCRKYQEQRWKVFCIRSNGMLLYDDLPRYLDNEGKYLLFFDDANQVTSFESILDYIYTMPNKYEIKIVITVRDYTKQRVIDAASKHEKPSLIKIMEFKDKEIKAILKNNLGIVNDEYLNRIAHIACGNIRLAMLAGLKSLDGGLASLNSALDVFENYYGVVFDNGLLTTEEIKYMCIVAFAGHVKLGNNDFYKSLLYTYTVIKDENDILTKLAALELVDLFQGEVVSISDQTMGDYILYYVLYRKKWISLCGILKNYFPKHKERIVYVINTLLSKFALDELRSFIRNQIIEAWNTCEENGQSYLEEFYDINPLKSLTIIKRVIDASECRELNITEEEIEKSKNYNIISKEIDILSGYRYLDCYEDAVDLLFLYYAKRPDLFMDFYFAITHKLLYDKNSFSLKYRQEEVILSKLWSLCDEGKEYLFSLLYIHVAEYALNTKFCYFEGGRKNREITFCCSQVVLTDEMKGIRYGIWKSLFVLRQKEEFWKKVNKILIKRYVTRLNDEFTRVFVAFDFDAIYPFIAENIDYTAAKIIYNYREYARSLHMEIDDRMLRAEENECFRVFRLLSRNHVKERSFKEDEALREKDIWNEIRCYSKDDFNNLFNVCKCLSVYKADNMWELDYGLSIVFSLLEGNIHRYVEILDIFFASGAPLVDFSMNRIVNYLLNQVGYTKTREIILKRDLNNKNNWLYNIWRCLSKSSVTREIANDFRVFIEQNQCNYIPDVNILTKYCDCDKSFLCSLSRILLDSKDASIKLLKGCLRDEEISNLFLLFEGSEDVLVKIYCNTFGARIDEEGKIFARLYPLNPAIWIQYVDYLKGVHGYDYSDQCIVDYIWDLPDYSERILYAFVVTINDMFVFNAGIALVLFGESSKSNNVDKKKKWLLDQLKHPENDLKRVRRLVNVVSIVFPEWEIEFILEYLKINKSIDDFKELHLLPLIRSWSGSEIPLINREINFLSGLKERLIGIEFLDHKQYLNEEIDKMERYKARVEIQEYLENV